MDHGFTRATFTEIGADVKNDQESRDTSPLSNDPGKKESNFYCCGAIRFPHIEMFSWGGHPDPYTIGGEAVSPNFVFGPWGLSLV